MGFLAPQDEQTSSVTSGVAHAPQNLALSRFSCPHAVHCTSDSPNNLSLPPPAPPTPWSPSRSKAGARRAGPPRLDAGLRYVYTESCSNGILEKRRAISRSMVSLSLKQRQSSRILKG